MCLLTRKPTFIKGFAKRITSKKRPFSISDSLLDFLYNEVNSIYSYTTLPTTLLDRFILSYKLNFDLVRKYSVCSNP